MKAISLLLLGLSFAFVSGHALANNMDKKEVPQGINLTEVVIVNLDQAKRLYELGAVFIDVRNDEEWRLGHIEGAQHVNYRKGFEKLKQLSNIDKETALVIYCESTECKEGPHASAAAMNWGYENVFYFKRGYFAWMLNDFPLVMNTGVTTFAGDTIQIRKSP